MFICFYFCFSDFVFLYLQRNRKLFQRKKQNILKTLIASLFPAVVCFGLFPVAQMQLDFKLPSQSLETEISLLILVDHVTVMDHSDLAQDISWQSLSFGERKTALSKIFGSHTKTSKQPSKKKTLKSTAAPTCFLSVVFFFLIIVSIITYLLLLNCRFACLFFLLSHQIYTKKRKCYKLRVTKSTISMQF